ncbi:response regulator containing CheY-like receiver [endosymbiont of Acanthamoeba sp. UWC8]|uniref:sigma-54-dependent transcriptional regulator n=1 Tax=endosymbiont of Acanthamoeba sp. UWC8 TaxID=86106 RepID=UPI0004D1AA9B|nr:sigma-54 dependent transcriptional regulator [endosymbiont of Acanthamoeba sp. UWC8]AIF81639.1 response regulator containing CheY-like receiver [endosymbiont of Acanthamoeba sp. UWC8]
MAHILIVDDEADIRELVADILKDEGYHPLCASSASETIQCFENNELPSAVVLDIWLEGSEMDGIGILKYIKSNHPTIPVIMISGHGNIETAVQTIRHGAYDFIEKPFKAEKLIIMVNRAIEASRLAQENKVLKSQEKLVGELIGTSKAIQQLKTAALMAAPSNSRIIITGEPGSGKEVLARLIHDSSKRAKKPFCILHASNLSEEQLEVELFGTENKSMKKAGLLEKADHGTLYIDEISEMPVATQGKLLKFLQTQTFQKIGGSKDLKPDVRIIAASSKNLEEEITSGKFNQSLYYRLNVVPLKVPPLTERKEDIKHIAEHFLKSFSQSLGVPYKTLTQEALTLMSAYDWPGNLRQLSNVVEWLYIMTPDNVKEITADILPQEVVQAVNGKHKNLNPVNSDILSKELKKARELFEKEYLYAQLNRFSWNISKTADFIGMDRTALHRKIKSLNIKMSLPVEDESEELN